MHRLDRPACLHQPDRQPVSSSVGGRSPWYPKSSTVRRPCRKRRPMPVRRSREKSAGSRTTKPARRSTGSSGPRARGQKRRLRLDSLGGLENSTIVDEGRTRVASGRSFMTRWPDTWALLPELVSRLRSLAGAFRGDIDERSTSGSSPRASTGATRSLEGVEPPPTAGRS
jgi:hypothetical protein